MSAREVAVGTMVRGGVGELGTSLEIEVVNRCLRFFRADTLRVGPTALGAMTRPGRGWDAITDPGMGHRSDTTRSRWGRRRASATFCRAWRTRPRTATSAYGSPG